MTGTVTRSAYAMLAGLFVLGACGASETSGDTTTTMTAATTPTETSPLFTQTSSIASTPPTDTAPNTATEAATDTATTLPASTAADTATTTPTGATTEPPTATSTPTTPLDLVDGKILGIGYGSSLSDAERTLGIVGVLNPDPAEGFACIDGDAWVIGSNNLHLFFERSSGDTALLTNWSYTGGPALGYSELIAPVGIRIGDSRDALVALYGDTFIDDLTIGDPFIEFVLDNDVVEQFGIVECVTETVPDDS